MSTFMEKYYPSKEEENQGYHKIELEQSKIERYRENKKQLIKEVAKINLRQYYHMNPIELTCTSVDLDSKILRFFNHKTTPYLPVCKAVQMTGSFPVAFQAQKWQKEWGYYYIHYYDYKVMIDL